MPPAGSRGGASAATAQSRRPSSDVDHRPSARARRAFVADGAPGFSQRAPATCTPASEASMTGASLTTTEACAHATRAAASAPSRRRQTRHSPRRPQRRRREPRTPCIGPLPSVLSGPFARSSAPTATTRLGRRDRDPVHHWDVGRGRRDRDPVHHWDVGRGLVPRRSFAIDPEHREFVIRDEAATNQVRGGRRDTRHVVRTIADANHRLHASGLSPRSCRTLRAILA